MESDEFRAAIDEQVRRWEDLFNSGELRLLAQLYGLDSALMTPDYRIVRGRTEIESFWDSARNGGVASIQLQQSDVLEGRGLAVETGIATVMYELPTGIEDATELKYANTWRHSHGDWELLVSVFGSLQSG